MLPHHDRYRKFGRHSWTRRAAPGQVIVIFALFMVVLVGSLALAVDVGFLMSERRQAQSAADAAAMAADKAYQRNQIDDIVPTGKAYAEDANFTADEATITPLATWEGYELCVQADIGHDVDQWFLSAFYSGEWRVETTAIACTERVQRPYAMIALDPDGDGINSAGTSSVEIQNDGGAMSNATIDICGTASWLLTNGPLDAFGNIDICANADVTYGSYNPASGMSEDPLADVDEPDCSGMTEWKDKNPADPTTVVDVEIKSTDPTNMTVRPGYYPNGLDIKDEHNITFESGVYCFGADFKASSGSSKLLYMHGDNVLFYFEDDAMLNINGEGIETDWTAGDGGACNIEACERNIVVFYQRTPTCNDEELRLTGNVIKVDGIIYNKCGLLQLGGNNGSEITGQLIAAEITIVGGSDLVIIYTGYVDTYIPLVYLVD